MSKECKIYYGTVINEDGNNWAKLGSHMLEPVRVEMREPLGKLPDFCCKEFEEEWNKSTLTLYTEPKVNQPKVRWTGSSYSSPKVNFCPNCGAAIVLVRHLKLRVVGTARTVTVYYVEEAE